MRMLTSKLVLASDICWHLTYFFHWNFILKQFLSLLSLASFSLLSLQEARDSLASFSLLSLLIDWRLDFKNSVSQVIERHLITNFHSVRFICQIFPRLFFSDAKIFLTLIKPWQSYVFSFSSPPP